MGLKHESARVIKRYRRKWKEKRWATPEGREDLRRRRREKNQRRRERLGLRIVNLTPEQSQDRKDSRIKYAYMRGKVLIALEELSREGYISQFNPYRAKMKIRHPELNVTTLEITLV